MLRELGEYWCRARSQLPARFPLEAAESCSFQNSVATKYFCHLLGTWAPSPAPRARAISNSCHIGPRPYDCESNADAPRLAPSPSDHGQLGPIMPCSFPLNPSFLRTPTNGCCDGTLIALAYNQETRVPIFH